MDFMKIDENIAILKGFINIGLIWLGKELFLIDSGLEEEAKELNGFLREKGLSPAVLINTHAHQDHCGANNYLQKHYNLDIFAAYKESLFIENPLFEAYCFSSGASPLEEMKTLLPSRVTDFLLPGEKKEIKGGEFFFPSLVGHSIDQIGVGIGDILFCGDAFFSPYVLERYKLPFLVDLDRFLASLEYLKKSNYRVFIPAHGEATTDIETVVDLNIAKVKKIEEDILNLLVEEKSIEDLLEALFSYYEIKISRPDQYFPLKTTVMAYLSSLSNRKSIRTGIKGNILSWRVN
ncbi:MAG TPA: MBL fold metallo-hydrolase [Halanaerobiales bacterium]|nr:MBL fold metallo-hydrolase [Halanaerobiales bacterium]HPZ62274.1 MBL fold metallo-hydrolase [Halanaerobiales bacterium]HQD03570.1 MBL fold metallo-hydrolase [Halanaerobiales bacterium]